MRRNRKAKVVATLGPASSDPETLRALFDAGVDVFRLNFSHGTHESHLALFERIRAMEAETGRPIGIMADLQGPKIRLGDFANGPIQLNIGDKFRLDLDPALGDQNRVHLPHPPVFKALSVGSDLLIDDGKVRLRVDACGPDFAETTCIVDGEVKNHKGVNVPGVELPISTLTEKDHIDLQFALEQGADWIAQSFVQKAEDVAELKAIVGDKAAIIVKLEQLPGMQNLEGIVELTDALMVARGDLGVEMPPEQVPSAQKRMMQVCRAAGKPVVVATHMLDSMVSSPVPTRAEVSDVANAVYEGADCVMLSAESASGNYPVQAVTMMSRIVEQVESDPYYRRLVDGSMDEDSDEVGVADAVCSALRQVSDVLDTKAIATYTASGNTTLSAARERPKAPILALTPDMRVARKLTMVWGTHPVQVEMTDTAIESLASSASAAAVKDGFAEQGDIVALAAGLPFGTTGSTNLLHIIKVEK